MEVVQCRNCGSSDRYEKEVNSAGGYGPDLLPIKKGFFETVKFRLEVCGTCGLAQWFVPERFLERVRANFARQGSR